VSFLLTALVRGELASAWSWSDEPEKPLESADAVLPDTKFDGNGSIAGVADVLQVEEKVEIEPEGSGAESKPKKKSKKKAT
jgi:hypothetical protein